MQQKVSSLNETEKLAKQFATSLKPGDVVVLHGDLGAGKTTFTQFVFKALGVKESVTSPTFAILKTYQGKDCLLHHFDAYRITNEEAIEAGFDEIIAEPNSIKFIEWSDNILALLPDDLHKVNIRYLDETSRIFEIE